MSTRRGKKINPEKNFAAAKDFAAGKKVGRQKQVWVWGETKTIALPHTPLAVGDKLTLGNVLSIDTATGVVKVGISGHWETVNVRK